MQAVAHQGWQGPKGSWIALFAGAILPLAFSPFKFYPIALFSLLLLFSCWQNVTPRQAAWRGFLFGLGLFGVGVSWVFVAIHEFGHSSIILGVLLTSLFVAFLALYIALLGWLIKKLSGPLFSSLDYLLLLPVGWLVFEAFKGWFLTGFPWLDVGTSQIDGLLAGYVPIIGVLGTSWLVALTAGLILASARSRNLIFLILAVIIWGGGPFLDRIDWTTPTAKPIKATLIQGNIPQDIKWNREQLFKTLALYDVRTEQHWSSDLVVWPENAVTAFYHQVKKFYLDPLGKEARAHHTDILVGLPVMNEASGEYYNSIMTLGSDQGFYFKRHLVPFGDYVPLKWLRGLIAFFDLPMSGFSPGPEKQPLLHAAGYPIGVTICYEDAFSREVLQTVPQAKLLVNATNNAWYGDSFAPHQALQISRSRALEVGRPALRATTNGISAFIDYKGRIVQRSPQFKEVTMTEMVQPRDGETPYVMWGQWPLLGLSVIGLIIWFYRRRYGR